MVELKDLYCGAFDDIPFVSIKDLKEGKITETTYYSESPFLCFSDIGGALLKAFEKCNIELERARVDLDKVEPMNIFIITLKTTSTEIKLTTGKYVKPSRDKRPPRTENKGVYPWGYYLKIDMSGKDEDVYQILSEFLLSLKREPWEGLLLEEFNKETGIWEDDLKESWLNALSPVLDEYNKKVIEARNIKVDTKEVESYLKDAKKALKDRKLTYLIHLINKMDFEHIDARLKEERGKGHEISQKILELQNIIKEGRNLGLDTVTAEHYLKTAKKHMFEKEWDAGFEAVGKAEEIVKALKTRSRPQVKLSLVHPEKYLVEEENNLILALENIGNVPAAKIKGSVEGDIAVANVGFPENLDRDQKVDVAAPVYSELGGLKTITIKLEYSREYDDAEYSEEKKVELFFVDKDIKLDTRSNVEFQAGFIRVDLALINGYPGDINNVEVEAVIKDDRAELVTLDPRYSIINSRIQLGTIGRNDLLQASLFLDPIYNEDFYMKFEVNFEDNRGKKKFLVHPMEAISRFETKCVVGDVPSSKSLIEKLASTHNKYIGKIFELPVSTTTDDCYDALRKTAFSLPSAQVWENDVQVVRKTKGRKGASKTEAPEKVRESWYTIQDQEPGFSAGLHIRVNQGTDSVELSVAANDMIYAYSLLLQIQDNFTNELIERKFLAKESQMKQTRNPWLRQRIRGRQTAFLKMQNLEDVDMEKKVAKAAKERENKFSSLREQELKAYKYKAWSGSKK